MASAKHEEIIAAWAGRGRRLEVPGAGTTVWTEGTSSPVVCLHGVPSSAFLYRKVLPELAAGGQRGVAFDLPGLGSRIGRRRSTTPGPAWPPGASRPSTRSSWTGSISWCTTSAARSASTWWRASPIASPR